MKTKKRNEVIRTFKVFLLAIFMAGFIGYLIFQEPRQEAKVFARTLIADSLYKQVEINSQKMLSENRPVYALVAELEAYEKLLVQAAAGLPRIKSNQYLAENIMNSIRLIGEIKQKIGFNAYEIEYLIFYRRGELLLQAGNESHALLSYVESFIALDKMIGYIPENKEAIKAQYQKKLSGLANMIIYLSRGGISNPESAYPTLPEYFK